MRTVRVAAAVLCGLLLSTGGAVAQERKATERPELPPPAEGREHFQLKIGAGYDQGNFGTNDTTRSFYVPVTFRYLGERFDVGVTASIIYLDTESSVVVIDGQPTQSDRQRRSKDAGFGDLYFKGRYFLVDDAGPDSFLPGLAPFLKVKAPTADAHKGLGTGEWDVGLGLEWDKRFAEFFLLGDVSYTFIGEPDNQDFRNRPAFSIGIGRQFTPALAGTVMLDWRRSIVARGEDAVELTGIVQYRLAPTLLVSPYAFVGLTDGSPDFGLGIEVSWKFGRY
jgi:hypothetical protein